MGALLWLSWSYIKLLRVIIIYFKLKTTWVVLKTSPFSHLYSTLLSKLQFISYILYTLTLFNNYSFYILSYNFYSKSKSALCFTITILQYSLLIYIFTFTIELCIFMWFHESVQNPFISTCWPAFSISHKVSLLVINSLSICLPEEVYFPFVFEGQFC